MPEKNISVGEMYWITPIIESGMRWAASANQSSGMTVMTPVPTSSRLVSQSVWPSTPSPAASW